MNLINRLTAFLNGMREFRSDLTTRYSDEYDYRDEAYDWGREWSHRITFRRFDW